jgi:hypothetical protein
MIAGQQYIEALHLLATEALSAQVVKWKLHCNKAARNILDLRHLGCSIYHLGDIISEAEMNNILSKPLTRKRFRKGKVT